MLCVYSTNTRMLHSIEPTICELQALITSMECDTRPTSATFMHGDDPGPGTIGHEVLTNKVGLQ